jgi:hypothetical protein
MKLHKLSIIKWLAASIMFSPVGLEEANKDELLPKSLRDKIQSADVNERSNQNLDGDLGGHKNRPSPKSQD